MSDPASTARTARENLSRGLSALQSDPNMPPGLRAVAEPIAQAMGALHQIERSNGAALHPHANVALDCVRKSLAQLQAHPPSVAAVGVAMEAVAASLGLVHALAKLAGPAQQQAQPAPPPPQAAPPPPQAAAAPGFPQQGAQQGAPAGRMQPQPSPGIGPAQPHFPAPAAAPAYAPAAGAPAYAPAPAPAYAAPPQQPPMQQQPMMPQAVRDPFAAPAPAPMAAGGASPLAATGFAYAGVPGGAPGPAPAPTALGAPAGAPGETPLITADLGAQSATNFYKGLSGNDIIDHGGLFVSTYKIPKIGAPVRLKVSLPGGYEFEANAIVRWAREQSDGSDAPPGFGAQFTQITQEARHLVYRYVRNREPLFHDDL